MRCFSLQAVYDWSRSLIVPEENRAVQAIGEHIRTGGAVVGGGVPIRTDEPTKFRVIVPAGDVVQLRLAVVVVAPIAEGVAGGKIGVVTAGGQDIAPAVVGEEDENAGLAPSRRECPLRNSLSVCAFPTPDSRK